MPTGQAGRLARRGSDKLRTSGSPRRSSVPLGRRRPRSRPQTSQAVATAAKWLPHTALEVSARRPLSSEIFIRCISLSHIFSIEFPLVILRLLDSLNGLSRVDSEISAFLGKIWPRGGCRSGRLGGKHAESGRPADWMTDSISETQSTSYLSKCS